MRASTALLLAAGLLAPGTAPGATQRAILDAAARAADRLPAVRDPGRTWEDAPYLVGLLLLAGESERLTPGSGRAWVDRAASVVGGGASPIANGDFAGYAQAAMDLYRIAPPGDAPRRADLLAATDGPLEFAFRALRVTPSDGPPAELWWLEQGYGTRFWVDDLFTLPPWLAMRGSSLDSLPGDPQARDLAYEWIESYLYDHRPPATTEAESEAVPSHRSRAGELLWDPALSLFRHDTGPGRESYWGRGNGWAAWGLSRSARYLDAPYGGGRYDEVLDRTAIRGVLAHLAASLAVRRRDDGGWPTDLLHPDACAASETSATGLIAYMLAKGVNEGWLDRATFVPIFLKAFSLLLGRIDAAGDVSGIQPPGTGPDCAATVSNDVTVNVSYGVGALLLAASEALKLPDADLATLEDAAARPVDRNAPEETWIVALPDSCDRPEVVLTNPGTAAVNVRLPGSVPKRVPPGATVALAIAAANWRPGALVVALRADGDLAVQPRGACDAAVGADEPHDLLRLRSRRAGIAVPLWTALSDGEATAVLQRVDGFLTVGGLGTSPKTAALLVTVASADGSPPELYALDVPAGGAAFETLFVPRGARVTLSNASVGAALVPLVFARPGP